MQADERRPAGFWRRAAAALIDLAILGAAGYGLGFTIVQAWTGTFGEDWRSLNQMQLALLAGAALLGWLYFALAESGAAGATPGKQALGLRVTRAQGGPVSFWRAGARFAVKIVSALLLGIGFWMAGFTRRKQTLHDLAAGTLVIRS